MTDKMRAALEAANAALNEIGIRVPDRFTYPETIKMIDEALKEPVVDDIEQIKDVAFHAGYEQRSSEIMNILYTTFPELRLKNQLLELPNQIQAQCLEVAKTAEIIEVQRTVLEKKYNEHMGLVTSATETDEKGKVKQKFGNEQARKAAVESLIADDKDYKEKSDDLRLKEALLKRQEIELEHSHNMFRAFLAISQMRGVV